MRALETSFLKDFSQKLAEYKQNHSTAVDFFAHINEVGEFGLQKNCREHDFAFLGELSRVLSVIMSIVGHPHLTNRREEIVSRIEQVQQLSNEDFGRTLKESRFWKKRGLDMVPEQVYYYQQVDELIIYENKFICMLVDMIDNELVQYMDMYMAMLPSMDANNNIARADATLSKAIKRIELLRKRVLTIKNTRFYKIVSKSAPIDRNVQKTNILIHDNLYKQCYMFYGKLMVYLTENDLLNDLSSYYLTLIFNEINNRGYSFVSEDNGCWHFASQDFDISLSAKDNCSFELQVTSKYSERKAKHLLIIDEEPSEVVVADGDWDSVDIMTVWNLIPYQHAKDSKSVSQYSETQLVSMWFASKTTLLDVTPEVYNNICPVCKAKIVEAGQENKCFNCHTKYRFVDRAKDVCSIWFVSRGRIL